MRCIVTGATGFIGSNLAKQLMAQGHEVFLTKHEFDLNRQGMWENAAVARVICEGFTAIPWGDLPPIDVLFHQAAIADTLNMDDGEQHRVNCEQAIELFCRAAEHRVTRIVYASSSSLYGVCAVPAREDDDLAPLNPYAQSKMWLDKWVKDNNHCVGAFGASLVGLRYGNVYGPGERHKGRMRSVVRQCWEAMSKGARPTLFADGTQERDWVYVRDVVEANVRAGDRRFSPCQGIYNVGTGHSRSYNDVVAVLNRLLGTALEPEYVPCPFGDRYQGRVELDVSAAARALGFHAGWSLEAGVADYLWHLGRGDG